MKALTIRVRTAAALAISVLTLVSCATAPTSPENSEMVRNKLTDLQGDPELSSRARMEIREAESAVETAEKPIGSSDSALGDHRVYMADQKIEIARAKAATKLAEDQRVRLSEVRSDARLQARTREADRAYADAASARSSEADMQRRMDELEAKQTDRGMVVTLGDVLFDTGSAQLRSGVDGNLKKLQDFLTQYSDRRVLIEGHTDNVGSNEYNRTLSRQRAESVKKRLESGGIASDRMTVSGKGLDQPVASNSTASGRQQNRRVEIVIENSEEAGSRGEDSSRSHR